MKSATDWQHHSSVLFFIIASTLISILLFFFMTFSSLALSQRKCEQQTNKSLLEHFFFLECKIVLLSWRGCTTSIIVSFCSSSTAGHQPLGISSGHVSDSQISVESGNKIKYPPYNVRLNLNRSPGGWCTTQSWGQTLVIDLGKDHFITKVNSNLC